MTRICEFEIEINSEPPRGWNPLTFASLGYGERSRVSYLHRRIDDSFCRINFRKQRQLHHAIR